jgi:hypothetical protein
MKVDIAINTRISIELTPETDLERLVLKEMRGAVDNGQPVSLGLAKVDSVIVSVGK